MYTKEIGGKLYEFNFGLGFVREIDKAELIDGDDKRKHKMGLTYAIAGLMDCDFEKLIVCLLIGSKFAPGDNLSRKEIEEWLESEDFDLEKECEDLLDFFEKCNFTKKKTAELKLAVSRDKEIKEAQYQAQLARAGQISGTKSP